MILDQIVASTRRSLALRQSQTPLAEIRRLVARQASPRDFAAALKGPEMKLIAEVKRASPSQGLLRPNLDAAELGRSYSRSGAAAISVLTESDHFRGSLADLATIRAAVAQPLLRKDFIIDPYQIYEARAHGADAVLIIAAILSPAQMKALVEVAHSLGMAALVEVHSQQELSQALEIGPQIIGINNRNLADFSVDLRTTLKLRPLIPKGTLVVSESGIRSRDNVLHLEAAGVNAILVGEALVRAADPAAKIAELLGKGPPRD